MVRLIPAFLTALGTICVFTASGHAAAADFYSGKTIRIVVGFSPGGAFDAYSRSLSRHMRKHLPGNPNIAVENMPGAGSLIAANYLYKAANPDGLTIGNFIGSVLMGQILGQRVSNSMHANSNMSARRHAIIRYACSAKRAVLPVSIAGCRLKRP